MDVLCKEFSNSESKLLDSIGLSRMEQELQKRVTKVTREKEANMIERT